MAKITFDDTKPADTEYASVLGNTIRTMKTSLNTMFTELYNRIDAVDNPTTGDTKTILDRLDTLDDGTGAFTVQELEDRILALDDATTGTVPNLVTRLDALDEGSASATTIAALSNSINTNTNDINAASTGLKARISAAEINISNNATAIADLESSPVVDITPPVGSIIYLDTTNTPTDLGYSGTWEAFGKGRVLLGSGTGLDNNSPKVSRSFLLGATNGKYEIELEETNIPTHDHSSNVVVRHGDKNGQSLFQVDYDDVPGDALYYNTWEHHKSHTNSGIPRTEEVGDGAAFDNMIPYQVVNIWKRTA